MEVRKIKMEVNPPGPTSINRSVRHINIIIIVTVDSRSVWRNSYFARRLPGPVPQLLPNRPTLGPGSGATDSV